MCLLFIYIYTCVCVCTYETRITLFYFAFPFLLVLYFPRSVDETYIVIVIRDFGSNTVIAAEIAGRVYNFFCFLLVKIRWYKLCWRQSYACVSSRRFKHLLFNVWKTLYVVKSQIKLMKENIPWKPFNIYVVNNYGLNMCDISLKAFERRVELAYTFIYNIYKNIAYTKFASLFFGLIENVRRVAITERRWMWFDTFRKQQWRVTVPEDHNATSIVWYSKQSFQIDRQTKTYTSRNCDENLWKSDTENKKMFVFFCTVNLP